VDVVEAVEQAGSTRQGVVAARDLHRLGVSSSALSRAAQAGRVLRVLPRTYALEALPAVPARVVTADGPAAAYVLHVRAVLTALGGSAAARGRTAAALRGWGLLVEPSRTVDVAVPHGRSRVALPGVRAARVRDLRFDEVRAVAGCRPLAATTAVRTVLDCACELPLLEAVVVTDSALRSRDVRLEELLLAARRLPGRDAARVRRVLALADELSGSVLESVQRVRMVLAGLVGFDTQLVVCDRPYLRVDFCFRAAGLVVEVDGEAWHRDAARDRARDNLLARLGWRVLRYGWTEVVHEHGRVQQEIRAALACGTPSTRVGGPDLRAAA
jgi:very-short-patch-repair endonuclease